MVAFSTGGIEAFGTRSIVDLRRIALGDALRNPDRGAAATSQGVATGRAEPADFVPAVATRDQPRPVHIPKPQRRDGAGERQAG